MRQLPGLKCSVVLIAMVSLAGCQDFFTNSLAKSMARDQSDLVGTVTTSNLDDYLKLSGDNPELALAVLGGINTSAASASGSDLIEFQTAAATLSGDSSEIGSIFYSLANEYLNDSSSSAQILDILDTKLDGLPQLAQTSALLQSILPTPGTTAFDDFVASATQDELAIAAVVIISAQAAASAGTVNDYFGSFTATTAAENLAVALGQAAAAKNADDGFLSDILSQLALVP